MPSSYPSGIDAFPTRYDLVTDVTSDTINSLRYAVEALQTKLGIDSSVVATSIDYKVNNFFTPGRKLWIYQNSAPTGWSVFSASDSLLAVTGGTTYEVGETQRGSWTHPGHAITVEEMPNHVHAMTHSMSYVDRHYHGWAGLVDGVPDAASGPPPGGTSIVVVAGAHYAGAHNHSAGCTASNVGQDQPHYHGGTGNNTYRPSAGLGIIIEKS